MPMNSAQLAALVERARQKAPPVVINQPPPSPSRPMRGRQTAVPAPTLPATARTAPSPPRPSSTPQPETANKPEDFPTGWVLGRESWRFHRRFYAVFRRPMHPREYSYLLHQIPNRAEHLGDDCWRVTLPDGKRALPVRAGRWRLITILPKDWQPPVPLTEVPLTTPRTAL